METLIIVFILVLVIYLLSKNSKSITEEATLTRARQTEDYQKLYDNIYKFNEHYKEFDKLMRLLRKDIKSLNMVTDDLTTALNMKGDKKYNQQFYKDLITNINKFAKVKPKLKIVKTEKEKEDGKR
jgi:arginine deiminase|tara:strand:- start:451 stop:828 length:378 start_codon:yes stop_codon:yes gene_type:complete